MQSPVNTSKRSPVVFFFERLVSHVEIDEGSVAYQLRVDCHDVIQTFVRPFDVHFYKKNLRKRGHAK